MKAYEICDCVISAYHASGIGDAEFRRRSMLGKNTMAHVERVKNIRLDTLCIAADVLGLEVKIVKKDGSK
ncbi:MAG: hypothetical protein AB7F40_04535 [Victivallaceae bacterium]